MNFRPAPTPDFGPAILAMPLTAFALVNLWRAVGERVLNPEDQSGTGARQRGPRKRRPHAATACRPTGI